jgi:hypothetical protein
MKLTEETIIAVIKEVKHRFDGNGHSSGYYCNVPYNWEGREVVVVIGDFVDRIKAGKGYVTINREKYAKAKIEGKMAVVVLAEYLEYLSEFIQKVLEKTVQNT